MEEWKNIEWLDNNYAVSNLGRVRNNKTKRILKNRLNKYNYERITITYKNKTHDSQIHRLVLSVFEPNENANNLHVHHKDCNRSNNRLDNLVWLTCKENANLKIKHTKSYRSFVDLLLEYGDEKLNNILSTIKKGAHN